MSRIFPLILGVVSFASVAAAQWNPAAGQWGKSDPRDLRVMTWNVRDGICSTSAKAEGANNWCAIARIIAAMKPDVLILQECGDNSGNGTGGSGDSQANLATTFGLLVNGGNDPFRGNSPVGSWIRKYDNALTYPHIYVSANSDGFNRNVIMSRHPFADLNGDTRSTYDQFVNSSDLYAPGGGPGIRGWTLAEINLPDASYRGNFVIGNSHLKSGGTATDFDDRLEAAQNIAYFIDHWYNGAGGTTPDPRGRIFDSPAATSILDAFTPVVWGGDLNEDERDNGRDGPVLWTSRAQATSGDGTDRDRSDSVFDAAVDPLNANASNRNTQGSDKLDYLLWQDSIATARRSWVYVSASGGPAAYPPELIGYPTVSLASSTASDHRPVLIDFILPAPATPPGAFSLVTPTAGATGVSNGPLFDWTDASGVVSYTLTVDDNADFSSPIITQNPAVSQYQASANSLAAGVAYFWRVTATNAGGTTASTPASASFTTQVAAPGSFTLTSPADGSAGVAVTPTLAWSASSGVSSYRVRIADNAGLLNAFEQAGLVATAFDVPSGVLAACGEYWWTVDAINAGGTTPAANGPIRFTTLLPADFNGDGFVDFFDYDDFVACYEGAACPAGKDADFNGDGFVDFFDYDDFVLAYEGGC
jgi:endonuclease/exonuclease/phosphatase family metal-dependent hydrolase